jgi:exopolysaccharide biosynthesis polyprenyl glycosylphosphotransferase
LSVGRSGGEAKKMLQSKAPLIERLLRITDHGVAAGVALVGVRLHGNGIGAEDPFQLLLFVIVGTLAFPSAMGLVGLYRSQRRESLARIAGRLLVGAALTAVALVEAALVVGRPDWSELAASIAAAQLAVLAAERLAVHSVLRFARRQGRNVRHIVVIGTGPRANVFASQVAANRAWGIQIVAFLDEGDVAHTPGLPADSVHKLIEFPEIAKAHPIDEVVVALPRSMLALIEPIAAECALIGVPLSVLSDLFSDLLPASGTARYGHLSVLQFADVAYSGASLFVKRCIDLFVAVSLLLIVSPLIGLAMLAIRLTSPGPALYRQVRLGQNGRPFVLLKLRSMVSDAEKLQGQLLALNEASGPVFKMRNDPRVTPVGGFLRRWSIDELPQLWNVIRGDMSLVGPRPPLPHEVALYESRQRRRISVRPGLTCLWQIRGRSRIPFAEWVDLDLHYIDRWTLGLDLWILLRTPLAVLRRDGAS